LNKFILLSQITDSTADCYFYHY